MAKSFLLSGGQSYMNTAQTVYIAPVSGDVENNRTNEATRKLNMLVAGRIEGLYFRIPSSGGVFVIKTRINGADGNLAITTPASTSGHFYDVSGSFDTVAVNDDVAYSLTLSSGDGWPIGIGCIFNTTAGGALSMFGAETGGSVGITTTGTKYMPMSGVLYLQSSESDCKIRTKVNGTWKGMAMYNGYNIRTAATVFKSRINGADGNQACNVPASSTGWFQDTSNSDTVSEDDELAHAVTASSGSGDLYWDLISSQFVSDDDAYTMIVAKGDGENLNYNSTYYFKLGGNANNFSTWHVIKHILPGVVVDPCLAIASNSIDNGVSTFEVYNYDGDFSGKYIPIVVPAGSTGIFENAGHCLEHYEYSDGMAIRVRTSTTATTGSISFRALSTKHYAYQDRVENDGNIRPETPVSPERTRYTVADTTFSMATLTGAATTVALGDDELSAWINLPFTFNFFGDPKNWLQICSNGYLRFSGTGSSGSVYPTTSNGFDTICGIGADLDPSSGGTIKYETFGTAGSRIFVVEFSSVPYFGESPVVTFQIKLFEADHHVEIHIQDNQNDVIGWYQFSGLISSTGIGKYRDVDRTTTSTSTWRTNDDIVNEATSFTPA